MNERIKELAVEAGIISAEYNGFDPTGLTKAQRKFAELIVKECQKLNSKELSITAIERLLPLYKEHFGVEESKGWICPKCNADRTKTACPLGFGATVDGRCPMTVEAQ